MEIHAGYCVGESAGRLTSKGIITPKMPGRGYARRGEWGSSGAYDLNTQVIWTFRATIVKSQVFFFADVFYHFDPFTICKI
jgi:hypothetical protein